MNKVLLIINPNSGNKSSITVGNELQEKLRSKNIETIIYETTGQDNFKELVQKEMKNNLEVVIALGGDGTISEVINGIAPLKQRPKVMAIPMGTTNNFVQALGMELDLTNILKAIEEHQVEERAIDIGYLNDQYFISAVSIGALPEVAWKTDDDLKEKLGSLAYVLEGSKAINDFNPFEIKIETEEDIYQLDDVILVVIGLSNSIFGIESFFNRAEVDDGLLHLFALKKSNLINEASSIVQHIFNSNSEEDSNNDLSFVTSFKKAKISSISDLNTTVDGEKGSTFPLNLGVLHKHITFLIPKSVDL